MNQYCTASGEIAVAGDGENSLNWKARRDEPRATAFLMFLAVAFVIRKGELISPDISLHGARICGPTLLPIGLHCAIFTAQSAEQQHSKPTMTTPIRSIINLDILDSLDIFNSTNARTSYIECSVATKRNFLFLLAVSTFPHFKIFFQIGKKISKRRKIQI